jgi:hypothetical protein
VALGTLETVYDGSTTHCSSIPSLFTNHAAVIAASKHVGADTVITLDTSNTLKGVTLGTLTANDFKFGA